VYNLIDADEKRLSIFPPLNCNKKQLSYFSLSQTDTTNLKILFKTSVNNKYDVLEINMQKDTQTCMLS
jgi:hypothetical protein